MTRFSFFLLSLVTASSSVNAFTSSPFVRTTTQIKPAFTPLRLMADEEADALISSAMECAESECSVEDIDNFVGDLKSQAKILNERLAKINAIVTSLEGGNVADERDIPYLKSLLGDLATAVFDTKGSHDPNGPKTPPMGYSGDKFKGDAYSTLNPKPWKAPAE
eukprot:CAMPEP_0194317406 /NCGR_PEP_ID=MMETSP0171-20130528/14145_1 /TAXON_ID=218684 /ORGANISM="Corethron pennatum, Strain L29A3" /LENGTH=163 /DNA_ID=CAMNT_0039073977 /DNA_START=51 /DNA_END=542 /DNA_ORIENTATION=+